MVLHSWKIKFLVALFMVILIWQAAKLRSIYIEKSEAHEDVLVKASIVEKLKIQQVLVTVYYEALCPDSRSFVIKQLLPTYNAIEGYIEIQLVPYGKAETIPIDDDYAFKCQHGEIECEANIIHACSIDKIKDPKKQLEVIACMIKGRVHPQTIFKNCASELDEYEAISSCSKSKEGRKLLMKYGELTNELQPRVNFIPTITLDSEFDNQILILKNLLSQVCHRLETPPNQCRS